MSSNFFPRTLKEWAKFGDNGYYDELKWVAIFACTCGIGVPIFWLGKKSAQILLRIIK